MALEMLAVLLGTATFKDMLKKEIVKVWIDNKSGKVRSRGEPQGPTTAT